MYPNQGGYPNQPYPSPFGTNMPQAPPVGIQFNLPYPQQFNPQGMPNSAFLPQQSNPQQQIFSQQPATGMYPQMPMYQQGGYPMPAPQHQQGGWTANNPSQQYSVNQITMQHQISSISPQHSNTAKAYKGRPTLLPASNFNASNDAAALRNAMKGFGTDENAIINILCHRSDDQRIQIVKTYKTAYGKDLVSDIKSETSGNFEKLLVSLLTPTIEFYCNELNRAMVGAGTDEDVLIEVMCSMSNDEIRQIGHFYYRLYGKTLEETLRDDTSGNVKRLFTSLSVGGRDESMTTNVESARIDALALKKAGVDKWGTDEAEFNRILCLRSHEQLKMICGEYEKLTGNSLEKDIKKEFSGDIEDALLAIVRVATNRPAFFAQRLHKSMAGLGTNDRSLIRLCVTRAEIDMQDIKEEFQRLYSKSLKSFIKGDTSGHYRNSLYALCGEARD